MKFNLFWVGLSLILLLSVAVASKCSELDFHSYWIDIRSCITNNEGEVIELTLHSTYNWRGLINTGIFPNEILNLKSLEKLYLEDYIEFSNSTIPVELFDLVNLKELVFNIGINYIPPEIEKLTNLELFDIGYGEIKTLPDTIGNLKNLKKLYISSDSLESIPKSLFYLENLEILKIISINLSALPHEIGNLQNLKTLDISLRKITELPGEIGNLQALESLEIRSSKLSALPHEIGNLQNLKTLKITSCYNITELPSEIGNLQALESLDISYCSITKLPGEIGNLQNLETIEIRSSDLSALPHEIGNLQNLKTLDISYCNKLIELPGEIGNIQNLETLNLNSCDNITELPGEIGNLQNLKTLNLDSCDNITEFPGEIGNLQNLETLKLTSCKNITELPGEIGNLQNLKTLYLSYNSFTKLPGEIGNLQNLKTLKLSSCDNITELPGEIGNLQNLKTLDISYCNKLTELPGEIGNIQNLETLNLNSCKNITELPGEIGNLQNLKTLYLSYNSSTKLPGEIGNLQNLETLNLISCKNITELPGEIGNLQNLKTLDLYNCNNLIKLPIEIGNLQNLETLNISFGKITELPGEIGNLQNLKTLDISNCNKLTELPGEIGNLQNLETLTIYNSGVYANPEYLTELENNIISTYKDEMNDFCISPAVKDNLCPKCSKYFDICDNEKEKNTDIESNVEIYIYNASKNKCLRTTGLPDSSLTYGSCDNSNNTIWYIPNSHSGNYRSKANPDYCLTIKDGIVSLQKCILNKTLYRDVNFIKSPLSDNYCIGSSENDPNEIALKECDVNDPDQIWFFNIWDSSVVIEETPVVSQPETVAIYIYNASKNICLNSDDSSITVGRCDFTTDASLWEIPISHHGYYHPKANAEKCLSITDGVVSLGECNENSILYRDVNFIKSTLSDNDCISSSNEISIKECDANDSDQIWYFNTWDPSIAIEEPPVVSQPETVTIYFYNAYKNVCINSDGSSVTTGSCDFTTDDSLWEIPISHHGYYHPKANAEKCLSIMDGVVSLNECNENTELYRDELFIRSPLSDNYCITSSRFDNTLEYSEGCELSDPDTIWYFNIWTPPADEIQEAPATEIFVPTTVAEEKPTMTIDTSATDI